LLVVVDMVDGIEAVVVEQEDLEQIFQVQLEHQ
jgi:hypothetical protein